MTYSEIEKLCERDENGKFIRLKIPANEPNDDLKNMKQLDCIGRSWKDFQINEVIRIKAYIGKLSNQMTSSN